LICQPAQRRERNHSICTDYNESFQLVTNSGQPALPTISTDAVINEQVAAINANMDTVTAERHNAMPRLE